MSHKLGSIRNGLIVGALVVGAALTAAPAQASGHHHSHSFFALSFGFPLGYGPAYGPAYAYPPAYAYEPYYGYAPYPPPPPQQASGQSYCREFQTTIVVDGRPQDAHGTACQQPDGTWQVVN
jgi:hypothetical protein